METKLLKTTLQNKEILLFRSKVAEQAKNNRISLLISNACAKLRSLIDRLSAIDLVSWGKSWIRAVVTASWSTDFTL